MDVLIKIVAMALTISQVFTRPPAEIQRRFDPAKDQERVSQLLLDGCAYIKKEFELEDLNLDELVETALDDRSAPSPAAPSCSQTPAAPVAPAPPAPPSSPSEAINLPATKPSDPTVLKLDPKAAAPTESNKPIKDSRSLSCVLQELKPETLKELYAQICKPGSKRPIDVRAVIELYNRALTDLPGPEVIDKIRLSEPNKLFDEKGQPYADLVSRDGRRQIVPLAQIPEHTRNAFLAAEDKTFYEHNGVSVKGVMRAFMASMTGKLQGGSTITQQLMKNVVVGDDRSIERKIREAILAAQVEGYLQARFQAKLKDAKLAKKAAKDHILELYFNAICLGRATCGLEMAAQAYFGHSAEKLTISESAALAGLNQGPSYNNPNRHQDRFKMRWSYVLERMLENKYITEAAMTEARNTPLKLVHHETPRSFYVLDAVRAELKDRLGSEGADILNAGRLQVRTTINPALQQATELAVQDGLLKFEQKSNRNRSSDVVVGNLTKAIEANDSDWRREIVGARTIYSSVQWPVGVALGRNFKSSKGKDVVTKDYQIGLADGTSVALEADRSTLNKLQLYDLIYVSVESRGGRRVAKILNPPEVQGAAIVLEARTGRVLAMTGGFSYAFDDQLNRALAAKRPPGSTIKPLIYLSLLQAGYQPNSVVPNAPNPIPIPGTRRMWQPDNYENGPPSLVTLGYGLAQSLNRPIANGVARMVCRETSRGCVESPIDGLQRTHAVAQDFGLIDKYDNHLSFILGDQGVRLVDMAAVYATIANIAAPLNSSCPTCLRPKPHFTDEVALDGKLILGKQQQLAEIKSVDRVSIYQMRTMMKEVIRQGTAQSLAQYADIIAGKTGTTSDFKDAWFLGMTNDLVVAVWVGYDDNNNAWKGSLGRGKTGASIALPIARTIFEKAFTLYGKPQPLSDIPPDVARQTQVVNMDYGTGELSYAPTGWQAVIRRDPRTGELYNTRESLLRNSDMQYPYVSQQRQQPTSDMDDDGTQGDLPDDYRRESRERPRNPYGGGGFNPYWDEDQDPRRGRGDGMDLLFGPGRGGGYR